MNLQMEATAATAGAAAAVVAANAWVRVVGPGQPAAAMHSAATDPG